MNFSKIAFFELAPKLSDQKKNVSERQHSNNLVSTRHVAGNLRFPLRSSFAKDFHVLSTRWHFSCAEFDICGLRWFTLLMRHQNEVCAICNTI